MDKNSTKYQVKSSPAIRATTASYGEHYILSKNGILNIYGNCTAEELDKGISERTEWGITLIQFARQFAVEDQLLYQLNKKVIKKFPQCSLRLVLNGEGAIKDLEVLKHLPNLIDLRIELTDNIDLAPINKFCKLKSLAIGGDKIFIKEITKQESIEELFVFERVKDIELIGEMQNLRKLTISNMSLKNLGFLQGLKQLKELHFILGGTKNLEVLSEMDTVEVISFTWVRELKMEHLKPINDMRSLKKIKFDRQRHLLNLDWLKDKSIKTEIISCKNFRK